MNQFLKFINFGITLYMFRTVFPPIIRSSRLYTQQQVCVKQILLLLARWNGSSISFPLASRQQYLFDIYLMLHVQSCTLDDGRKDRPKHVQRYSKINKFEKLVHLVGFTIEIYYDARRFEHRIHEKCNKNKNKTDTWHFRIINPSNAELNPICYLLPLLAHHFLHVSRIKVKSLTLRFLMSYIYIYIYIW